MLDNSANQAGKPLQTRMPNKTVASAIKAAQSYLHNHISIDGGWPYSKGLGSATEATSWCLIAMRAQTDQAKLAAQYLLKNQNSDGGWSTAAGAGKSDWCTGPALFAVRNCLDLFKPDETKNSLQKGMDYLAESRTEFYDATARIIIGVLQGEAGLQYARGWPWSPGCFHWVEPTSYNLYALKIPALPTQDSFVEVAQRANKFLVENTCQAGGWNHGSHLSLGVNLPPYVVTTAEALLALQDLRSHPCIDSAFKFLERESEASRCGQMKTAMALAWMTIAFHAYDRKDDALLHKLIEHQNDDGSFGPNMMTTALALIALQTSEGSNPFKFTWTSKKTSV